MLEINNLSFSYLDEVPILSNLNVSFESGKVIAIQGESGQGKSTLLSILSGLERDYTGEIVLDNEVVNQSNLYLYSKDNISMIFQELNLINYLSLEDNIKQGCLVKNKPFDRSKMMSYLVDFNITNLNLNDYPAKISGGQQQRIAIIRALLSDTKIILADEPTASIDNKNTDNIIAELKKLAIQEDKTVIIVTHDDSVAVECDEVYLLEETKLNKK